MAKMGYGSGTKEESRAAFYFQSIARGTTAYSNSDSNCTRTRDSEYTRLSLIELKLNSDSIGKREGKKGALTPC